jgi:hypothetical protein
MIKINLLSPLDKENLKWEKVNNLAVKNILWVVLSQLVFIGVFFFSIQYLKARSDATAARLASVQTQPQTQEIASIEREMKQNAGKVEKIYEAQKDHVSWTVLFDNISKLVPEGVKLEEIKAEPYQEKEEQAKTANGGGETRKGASSEKKIQVQITGNAKTRELLLIFEDKLKATPIFFDLEYDTSNYVKSADIDFRYVFYVKEQDLIQ